MTQGNTDSTPLDKVPPHNEEAEYSLIGAALLNNNVLNDVVQVVRPQDFYNNTFRLAFEAIVNLYEKGKPVDLVLLRSQLESNGKLTQVDFEKVIDAAAAVPSIANADYYAQIIREKSLLRELIQVSSDILKSTFDTQAKPSEILDTAESRIFEVAERSFLGQSEALRDILKVAIERIEENQRNGKSLTGMPTGYFQLDELLNGLQPADLLIIAGRPSMGKTTFALNILENIAMKENKAVALFSLEMAKEQIAENLLCAYSRVDSEQLKKGRLPESKWNDLMMGASTLSDAQIFIDDSPGITPLEIRAKSRRLKSRHDIQAIFIDYLQLMQDPNSRRDGRQQEISSISRALKALARELKVPVVVLSQLNRGVELRENHEPKMSDLRESGAIEQDADVIMLVHREDYYDPDKNPGGVQIKIAKHRNGPVGKVELFFAKNHKRFENPTGRRSE